MSRLPISAFFMTMKIYYHAEFQRLVLKDRDWHQEAVIYQPAGMSRKEERDRFRWQRNDRLFGTRKAQMTCHCEKSFRLAK